MANRNSWAILNAKCLFNDKNIKVDQVGKEWKSNAVYIVVNEKGSMKMLCSCGRFQDVAVGHKNFTHADQSGRDMGIVTVVNIVDILDGKVAKSENDVGLNKSMPVYVFK